MTSSRTLPWTAGTSGSAWARDTIAQRTVNRQVGVGRARVLSGVDFSATYRVTLLFSCNYAHERANHVKAQPRTVVRQWMLRFSVWLTCRYV